MWDLGLSFCNTSVQTEIMGSQLFAILTRFGGFILYPISGDTKAISDLLQQHNITSMPWPALCPDLSPIEPLRDEIQSQLDQVQPRSRTAAALSAAFLMVWNDLYQQSSALNVPEMYGCYQQTHIRTPSNHFVGYEKYACKRWSFSEVPTKCSAFFSK